MLSKSLPAIFICLGALTVRASDPQASAVHGVADAVAQAGGKPIHWIHTGEEQAAAERAVAALFQRPLTADSAAQIALLNNRALQAKFEGLGISAADYLEASLPGNPSVAASWRFPGGPPAAADIEYSIAQDLLSLLLLPARRKIAARELEITRLQTAAEVLALIADTKSAFYAVQAREQLLARQKSIAEANETGADLSQRQHEAGNITDLDLSSQQALYYQSKVEVGRTQAQIHSDREQLNRLLGAWGEQTNWRTRGSLPAIPEHEISLARLESKAVAQRLDLAAERQEIANLDAATSLKQKTRFFPGGVNIGADTERGTDRQRVTGPTLDLQLPLFNFGQGALLRLKAQRAQAERDLEAMTVNARSEVREAAELVRANRELAKYQRDVLLPQRNLIIQQTLLQYNAMQVGPQALLTARAQELEAERTYLEAWRDYWLARTALERALHGNASPTHSSPAPLTNNAP